MGTLIGMAVNPPIRAAFACHQCWMPGYSCHAAMEEHIDLLHSCVRGCDFYSGQAGPTAQIDPMARCASFWMILSASRVTKRKSNRTSSAAGIALSEGRREHSDWVFTICMRCILHGRRSTHQTIITESNLDKYCMKRMGDEKSIGKHQAGRGDSFFVRCYYIYTYL